MRTMMILGAGGLVFLSLMACSKEEFPTCDVMAAVSVTVTVVDEAGESIPGATVSFASPGRDEQACDVGGDVFLCWHEVDGELTLTASAPGHLDASETVTVPLDECGVIGQAVTLVLADACDDPPPAMRVTVLNPDGTPAVGEAVSYGLANADMMPQPCEEDGSDGVWACAPGVSGDLELYVVPAASDPFQEVFEPVAVVAGECGPETVNKTVTLSYLED